MCNWMTSLNKHSKNNGQKKKNLMMTLKPCENDTTFYRVRLLGFNCPHTDRDDPWIQRFVHQHWGVNKEKGYPVLEDEVTCPVTSYVKVEGDRYDSCKICTAANKYFVAFKESNWKDKDANKKNKEFGRKYQCIIPCYVLNNPNWDGDNNKFKVIILNDKKFAQEFRKKVEKELLTHQVFNGSNAVDCCIHVKDEVTVVNEGQPNEYSFKKRVIDRVVFSTKPYDIPSITKETVDAMGFDDEYYTTSTPEEINAFYKKYCTVSNDDIPMDDIPAVEPVKVFDTKPSTPVNNTAVKPTADIPSGDLDDLMSDPDDVPAPSTPAKANDDVDAEDLLSGLDL